MFAAAITKCITRPRSQCLFQGFMLDVMHQVAVLPLYFSFLQRNLQDGSWHANASLALLDGDLYIFCVHCQCMCCNITDSHYWSPRKCSFSVEVTFFFAYVTLEVSQNKSCLQIVTAKCNHNEKYFFSLMKLSKTWFQTKSRISRYVESSVCLFS